MYDNYLEGLNPYGVGAPARRNIGGLFGNVMTRAAMLRANRAAAFARPDIPGVPSRDAGILPASWPIFSFVTATGTNIVSQTMNPQTPLRGQRLLATVLRSGTSAAATAPLIVQLLIGHKPFNTTANGVPLEALAQLGFDNNVVLPPTAPGVTYILQLNLPIALTGTDTINVIAGVNGSAVY